MKTSLYNLKFPLSASIQSALSQSKATTTVFDSRALALTTGKKINSPYDNSTLYFKDMRLTEQADNLNSILDGLSNNISTLKTATSSIERIRDLLARAKIAATAAGSGEKYPSELRSPSSVSMEDRLSDISLTNPGDEIIVRTGDADKMESDYLIGRDKTLKDMGITVGEELKVKIGSDDWMPLVVRDEDMKVSDFIGQIQEKAPNDNFRFDIKNQKLTLSTTDRSPIILQGDIAEKLGFDMSTTHKITIEEHWTINHLANAISKLDENLTAGLDTEGRLNISLSNGDDLMIADLTGEVASSFGIAGFDDTGLNVQKRYIDQYDEVLQQIDDAVRDSIYNGTNLLTGDSLRAVFDEAGKNTRTTKGVRMDVDSMGLIRDVDWNDNENILEAVNKIEDALLSSQQTTQRFDQAIGAVQARDDYMNNMAGIWRSGAESLTGADLNEAGAELLAAQTQKELVNQIISITIEANSSLLSLF